ncbi:MAG: diacylglycerol kinase family protein [Hyphomonadaceae bacterium]|nr:diacylglycerol kinase family protein [Hyphomonadaceae bacterium]
MKTIALFNPNSGSVSADGGERLRAALETAGIRGAEIIQTDGDDFVGQLKSVAAQAPDLFVVWGGDGTLKGALETVGQATPNLLLLPGGTMNLLTKSIHGEKAWDQIVKDVIASPKRMMLPAGKANDELFFCALLAGAPAHFADARESLRRGDLMKAATEAKFAIDTLNNLQLDARYGDGYGAEAGRLPRTSIVGAVVGSLTQEGKGMEVAALASPTTGGALNVVWTSFFADWRSAPGMTVVPAMSMEIENCDGGDIPVIVDGEHIEAGSKVHVTFVEDAAQCLTAA